MYEATRNESTMHVIFLELQARFPRRFQDSHYDALDHSPAKIWSFASFLTLVVPLGDN